MDRVYRAANGHAYLVDLTIARDRAWRARQHLSTTRVVYAAPVLGGDPTVRRRYDTEPGRPITIPPRKSLRAKRI